MGQAFAMAPRWSGRTAAAVAVGGALGAAARWAVISTADAGPFPWVVLAVNVVGSIVLGVLLAEEWTHPRARLVLHDFGGIGFCGGLTTFSTFAVEVVDLVRDGHPATAAIYAPTSVASAIAGVVAGAMAFRRYSALRLPLEEAP